MGTPSREKYVSCLVCGQSSDKHYLGIDACRACAIFYRRTKKRNKPYICRKGTNKCKVDREDACKKCRYEQLRSLVGDGVPSYSDLPSTSSQSYSPPSPSTLIPLKNVPPLANPPTIDKLPLLSRLRRSYAMVCRLRMMGERSQRMTTEELISGTIMLVPATFDNHKQVAKVFIASLMDFCEGAFSEFPSLHKDIKWEIAQKYHMIFGVIECTYRSLDHFGDDDNLLFSGYTAYLDLRQLAKFYEGAPGATKDAEKLHYTTMLEQGTRAKRLLRSSPMEEMEMVAALGLELWNTENYSLPEELCPLFNQYRNTLLRELHVYYKDILGCEDYATKLGKLFLLVSHLKTTFKHMNENIEMLRLLDVFDGSELPYKLHCT